MDLFCAKIGGVRISYVDFGKSGKERRRLIKRERKMIETAKFKVDYEKCIGCGKCLEVCPGNMVGGNVLRLDNGIAVMVDQGKFGWKGCWKCQHCLAVCPEGAISVLGISPEEVTGKPTIAIKDELPKLIAYRRTCRAFKKTDVSKDVIDEILKSVSGVPTGGNNFSLEFCVVETRDKMRELYRAVFGDPVQKSMFDGEDLSALRLYDAPHLFIAHKAVGDRFQDGALTEMGLATAYFELIANAFGLGTVISTYSAEMISASKRAKEFLGIPDSHKLLTVIGFGYPKFEYARGVKKSKKINRIR